MKSFGNNSILILILLFYRRRAKLLPPAIGAYEKYYGFHQDLVNFHRNLDTFAKSLLHVNNLFNKEYGYKVRKVPAHMPHFIDKEIVETLQKKLVNICYTLFLYLRFQNEFDTTSHHRFRSSDDMQFAFSYFYFIISEKVKVSPSEIFDIFDTDKTGSVL